MGDIAIKLENVSKFYKLYPEPKDRLKEALHLFGKKYHKPFYALQGINLEVKKGDILGVVGRNGCGKSTLLKLITGVLQPDGGVISVKGKITALLELGAGFNPEFTGIDNIQFYARVLGISDRDFKEKLPLIIEFAELGDFLYQPVKTYSSGMKSRLGFAVAIHVDPEILILDEVLAVGDALFKRKCFAKMEEFFKSGKTIIYVSHDANSVNRICTRAVLIHEGSIVMDDEPKEVTKFYQKLLFAKSESIEEVVSEAKTYKPSATDTEEAGSPETSSAEKADVSKAYFVEGLRPTNTVEYRNEDVDIRNPRFVTMDGRTVNVLVKGEEYFYCVEYASNSMDSYNSVSFGFDIKAENGLHISSVQSVLSNKHGVSLGSFEPGDAVKVKFKFNCMLNSGFYYVNSGISEFRQGTQYVLNRGVDLSCFKVIEEPGQITGGLVTLISELEVVSDSEVLREKVL